MIIIKNPKIQKHTANKKRESKITYILDYVMSKNVRVIDNKSIHYIWLTEKKKFNTMSLANGTIIGCTIVPANILNYVL